jgi:hypothetical protein
MASLSISLKLRSHLLHWSKTPNTPNVKKIGVGKDNNLSFTMQGKFSPADTDLSAEEGEKKGLHRLPVCRIFHSLMVELNPHT